MPESKDDADQMDKVMKEARKNHSALQHHNHVDEET